MTRFRIAIQKFDGKEPVEFANYVYYTNNKLSASDVKDRIVYHMPSDKKLPDKEIKKLGWTTNRANYLKEFLSYHHKPSEGLFRRYFEPYEVDELIKSGILNDDTNLS